MIDDTEAFDRMKASAGPRQFEEEERLLRLAHRCEQATGRDRTLEGGRESSGDALVDLWNYATDHREYPTFEGFIQRAQELGVSGLIEERDKLVEELRLQTETSERLAASAKRAIAALSRASLDHSVDLA